MGKLVVVLLVLAGLLPVAWVAFLCGVLLKERDLMLRNFGGDPNESSTVFFHDTFLKIGGWNIVIHPQWWSVGFLVAGMVLILVGMIAILWPQASG